MNLDFARNNNRDSDDIALRTEQYRFNKFSFPDFSIPPRGFKPLNDDDYPISGRVNTTLRLSNAYSVTTADDYEVTINMRSIIEAIGGLPKHPEPSTSSDFWDMLREVMDAQDVRLFDPFETYFPRCDRWKSKSLPEVAECVHDEFPGFHPATVLADILAEKYGPVEIDTSIIPPRSRDTFIRKDFMVAFLNTWAMSVVAPYNFCAKYIAGRARPEEIIYAIKKGDMVDGVPGDILRRVKKMDIRNAAEFTAYQEGCPRHPSWPAMHAANGCSSFWMGVVLDLNPQQLCQLRLVDYNVAYARTIAGVHYPDDNIAGLNLGQEVVVRSLPRLLRDKYNANPRAVARKAREMRYNWNDFDERDPCPFNPTYRSDL